MNQEPKLPRPLEAFLVLIASFFFALFITQILGLLFVPDIEEVTQNSLTLKIFITIGEMVLILIPIAFVKMRNLSFRKIFRWNPIPGHLLLWSFIIGVGMSIVGDELDRLVNIIIPAPEFLGRITQALQINSTADFLLLVLGTVVVAALIEESLIRGFLQISLEKYQDVTRGVIYASLAWTIIHGMVYWAIQIFLLGIILGLLAWRTNSIVPSTIGHATINATALFFYNVDQDELARVYLWGNHVSPLVLILGVLAVIVGIKKFYNYYPYTPFQDNSRE